jgi:hypothetical protein
MMRRIGLNSKAECSAPDMKKAAAPKLPRPDSGRQCAMRCAT